MSIDLSKWALEDDGYQHPELPFRLEGEDEYEGWGAHCDRLDVSELGTDPKDAMALLLQAMRDKVTLLQAAIYEGEKLL